MGPFYYYRKSNLDVFYIVSRTLYGTFLNLFKGPKAIYKIRKRFYVQPIPENSGSLLRNNVGPLLPFIQLYYFL